MTTPGWKLQLCSDPARWDDFVAASAQGSAFCRWSILDRSPDRCERVLLVDETGIAAAAPVFVDEHGYGRQTAGDFTVYQGIMLSGRTAKTGQSLIVHEFAVLQAFVSLLAERYRTLAFCQSPQMNDLRPLQWHNYGQRGASQFAIRLFYTAVVDLAEFADFDAYVASIRTLRRRELKKAHGTVTIEPSHDLNQFGALHDATYAKQNIPLDPVKQAYRNALVETGLATGSGALLAARDETGKVVSMIFFLYDVDRAYYLFGANDPDARGGGASTLLMIRMIQDAAKQGVRYIDFCGANSPNRGDYKLSFNARLVPYFVTELHPAAQ